VALAANSCTTFQNTNLPCVEVPQCSTASANVTINKLSNGLGASKSHSTLQLCYDSTSLKFTIDSMEQSFYSNHVYGSCNDNVYNSDISEVFIAPWYTDETTPHCYSEIDVSPSNKIFESGIYNPNLNHSGISNYLIDCDSSGVTSSTTINTSNNSWQEILSIPWSIIDNPYGCPVSQQKTLTTASKVYRANFYRVNELVSVSTCSSSTCEYMAWSPTGSNPPAFHEPTKFGYLVLV